MLGGTNLFRLEVAAPDLAAFRARIRDDGVDLGGVSGDGRFLVGVNETWNRVAADALADRFIAAL